MGALWVFGTYRLTNIYVRGALGTVLATTFLPLAFYGLHSVLVDKKHKAWLALALGMSGLLCSHVLSVLLTSFCLLLYALFHFATLCKKETWIALIKAVLLTLGLCAFWLVPFLGWSSYEVSGAGGGNLVENAAHLSQMFHQFVFSMDGIDSLLVEGTQNELPISIGFWPLIGAIFYGFVRFDLCKDWFHQNKHVKQLGDFALFAFGLCLFASSSLFPYSLLVRFPILDKIRAMQFPWRLLNYASFFGTLLTTISVHCLLKGQKPKVASTLAMMLVLLTIFSCMPLLETVVSIDETNYKTSSSTLFMDADVLYVSPAGAQNRDTLKPPYFSCEDDSVILGISERDLLTVTVTFENPTGASQILLAPQYHYPNSYAMLNDETPLDVTQSITGYTQVVLPEGLLEGTITVGFVSFHYYRLGYGASLIALAVLCWILFSKRPKNCKYHCQNGDQSSSESENEMKYHVGEKK